MEFYCQSNHDMKQIEDAAEDLIITGPPYKDIDVEYRLGSNPACPPATNQEEHSGVPYTQVSNSFRRSGRRGAWVAYLSKLKESMRGWSSGTPSRVVIKT